MLQELLTSFSRKAQVTSLSLPIMHVAYELGGVDYNNGVAAQALLWKVIWRCQSQEYHGYAMCV